MEAHLSLEGWDNWRRAENEKTARQVELDSTGLGCNGSRRVSWSKQLSAAEAASYTVATILQGGDGRNPARLGAKADGAGKN